MLDEDFCTFLEYEICKAFKNVERLETKGFWCDGVLLSKPVEYYSQKYIHDHKAASLKAFIGREGQEAFELVFKIDTDDNKWSI